MRALLVDDERLALLQLKSMLEQEDDIRITGMFSSANQVLDKIEETAPDIVFVDIEMPEIDGFKLASQIRAAYSSVDIVFTSGSVLYAADAYEFYPLDYMRKPIDRKRLSRTLERARHRLTVEVREDRIDTDGPILICLGPLKANRLEKGTDYMKWRTSKAQELFAYLLHNQGQMVYRDVLFNLLWKDFDSERAAAQLYNTIYTVRSVLKNEGLDITITKGGPAAGYRLEVGSVRVDARLWEEALSLLPPIALETVSRYEAALSGYTGDYLAGMDYAWADNERERLRQLWLRHARQLSEFYHARGMDTQEENLARRVQKQAADVDVRVNGIPHPVPYGVMG